MPVPIVLDRANEWASGCATLLRKGVEQAFFHTIDGFVELWMLAPTLVTCRRWPADPSGEAIPWITARPDGWISLCSATEKAPASLSLQKGHLVIQQGPHRAALKVVEEPPPIPCAWSAPTTSTPLETPQQLLMLGRLTSFPITPAVWYLPDTDHTIIVAAHRTVITVFHSRLAPVACALPIPFKLLEAFREPAIVWTTGTQVLAATETTWVQVARPTERLPGMNMFLSPPHPAATISGSSLIEALSGLLSTADSRIPSVQLAVGGGTATLKTGSTLSGTRGRTDIPADGTLPEVKLHIQHWLALCKAQPTATWSIGFLGAPGTPIGCTAVFPGSDGLDQRWIHWLAPIVT